MLHMNLLIVFAALVALTQAAPAAPTLPKCDWINGPKYNPAGCKSTHVLEGRDFSSEYNAEIKTIKSTGNKADDAKICFEHARSVGQYGAVMEVGTVEPGHFKCIAKAIPQMEAYSPFKTVRPTTFTLQDGGKVFYSYQTLGQYQIPGHVVRVAFNEISVDLEAFKSMECDVLSFYSPRWEQTVWCKNFPKADNKTLILGEDCNHCRN